MRAITVVPGERESARLEEIEEPPPEVGAVLVEAQAAAGSCARSCSRRSSASG